jgi:hypothetical protein
LIMGSYKSDYDNAAASQNAQQTKQTVDQNVTTSESDVKAARKLEGERRAQGKPKARKP